MHLRWPDQTTLLLDALESRIDLPFDTDRGVLRSDLLVLSPASSACSPVTLVTSWFDSVPKPGQCQALALRWVEFISAQVAAMRAIAQRGVARGDLPDDSSVTPSCWTPSSVVC